MFDTAFFLGNVEIIIFLTTDDQIYDTFTNTKNFLES